MQFVRVAVDEEDPVPSNAHRLNCCLDSEALARRSAYWESPNAREEVILQSTFNIAHL